MLIEENGIEWVGDRVQIRLFDLDGSHETIFLYPAEALDILGWLTQERDKLLRINAQHIKAVQQGENFV